MKVSAAYMLKRALIINDLTQEQLARHTGQSTKHVSQVLTGKVRMTPRFAALAENYIGDDGLAAAMLVVQAREDAEVALKALRS